MLAITYLNRLSDLLFILARHANRENGDVLWVPGGERTAVTRWATHPVTAKRFDDFADVINPNRRTTHCWRCLSHPAARLGDR